MAKVESRTTDKLEIMADVANKLPEDLLRRLKSFELQWREVDDVAVPFIKVEFYEK